MKKLLLVVALGVVACSDGEESMPQQKPKVLSGTLDVDIRNSAEVQLSLRGDAVEATLKIDASWGVLPAGESISGKGRVEHFPAAGITLYTALFAVSAVTDGPCGSEPLTLALALERDGENPYVVGSLTPYCGKDTDSGLPARNPLRLAGQLSE